MTEPIALVHRSASSRLIIPVGARCEICRLACHNGSVCVDVHFGPKDTYGDNGNPLVAFNCHVWICGDCADTIAEIP